MSILKWDHAGLFVGGMLFATKGIELLASKTAHKAYVQATAFGLRCRDGKCSCGCENCNGCMQPAKKSTGKEN